MEDTKKEIQRLEKELLLEKERLGIAPQDPAEDLTEDLPEGLQGDTTQLPVKQIVEALAEDEVVLPGTAESSVMDELLLEQLMAEIADPEFDLSPEQSLSDETMVFQDLSAAINPQTAEYAEDQSLLEEEEVLKEKRDDKIVVGLMIAASVLCLGILGVLGYWLVAFL